jgi:hypothetical protein
MPSVSTIAAVNGGYRINLRLLWRRLRMEASTRGARDISAFLHSHLEREPGRAERRASRAIDLQFPVDCFR